MLAHPDRRHGKDCGLQQGMTMSKDNRIPASQEIERLEAEVSSLRAKQTGAAILLRDIYIPHFPVCAYVESFGWVDRPEVKPCNCPKAKIDATLDLVRSSLKP